MAQNIASIVFTQDQLTAVDQALAQLETHLEGLVALTPPQRRSLMKMGDKSEAFCRQTLSLLEQNPQVVPPSIGLTEAQSDLTARDQFRPRLQRLLRLSERAVDTDTALGSDVMVTALQGYALLKVIGKGQGLDGLRKTLGTRFARTSQQAEPKAA